jgi:hypothetical protein
VKSGRTSLPEKKYRKSLRKIIVQESTYPSLPHSSHKHTKFEFLFSTLKWTKKTEFFFFLFRFFFDGFFLNLLEICRSQLAGVQWPSCGLLRSMERRCASSGTQSTFFFFFFVNACTSMWVIHDQLNSSHVRQTGQTH